MNGLTYLAFTPDHPVEEAVKRYTVRFGRAPKVARVDVGGTGVRLLRVGPVEQGNLEDCVPQLILNFDEEHEDHD